MAWKSRQHRDSPSLVFPTMSAWMINAPTCACVCACCMGVVRGHSIGI